MGANKKIYGYYPTGDNFLPVQVDSEGRIVGSTPAAHHLSHDDGGSDEISLSGLVGTSPVLTTPVINTSMSGSAIATGAEVTAGTDNTKIVTPKAIGDAGLGTGLKSKVITATRDMTAASGDVAYTGLDFTPTSIICIATINETFSFSMGVADSVKANQAIQSPEVDMMYSRSELIRLQQAAGSQFCVVKTYDVNAGLTLTWTKGGSPTGTAQLSFLCFR